MSRQPPVPQPVGNGGPVGELLAAGRQLAEAVDRLRFKPPVVHVYNPLQYAWAPYEKYLSTYATTPKRVVFLGMNPGPFGMVQTGIPFGEIAAVRDWLQIEGSVVPPARQHAARPIQGFACPRREVSGQRVWNFFAGHFGTPQSFFREHLVINYCPLAFLEASGRNFTPDKLPAREKARLFAACDEHLRTVLDALRPTYLVGIGAFAFARGSAVAGALPFTPKVCQILHPSPASPAANRGWGEAALKQLRAQGIAW